MSQTQDTIRLTTAQAIIRYLASQFIEIDGQEMRLCGGGFGIFGHGNVTCLGEALNGMREELPLYRGQNEQSMGFAAAYAKTWLRQRFMFCTASAAPGTTNLLTSAALAHANRLPVLLLCGDTFLTRLPDPVLQQLEHYGNPALGVNDAFKAVTRYWDRITHPAQVIQTLPAALATLLDPADCGPAFLGLPQDVQGWAYDYPTVLFRKEGPPNPPRQPGFGRSQRGSRASENRRKADDHCRGRCAVFLRGGRTDCLCRSASDSGGGNHRRPCEHGVGSSAQHRAAGRNRVKFRQ